ncbi:MAG: hypothetical protein MJ171_05410 [Clostridia bacterium]|nr:hypothetical protein [Clostridia bacterium]
MYYEAAMVDALEIGVDSMLKNLSHDEVVDEFKKMLEEKEDGKVIKSYYEPKYKVKN